VSATPLVSVVMPVYNGETYLREAADSILGQTFADFEFIIVDDASTDSSVEIVRAYADPRIRLVRNDRNLGVSGSLNRAIQLARGTYVARMDADDVSRPERLARQVAFLDAHPACGVVGTWTEIYSERTSTGRAHRHPTEDLDIKYEVLFDSPFVHSTVMIRGDVFTAVGLYPVTDSSPYPEDFVLWSRIARAFGTANLPEALLVYREVPGSESRSSPVAFRRQVSAICADNLAHVLGMAQPDEATATLAAYVHRVPAGTPSPARVVKWISQLFRAADALSDAHDAPRGQLRRRAQSRAKWILRNYKGQLQSSVRGRARDLVRASGW
jgi:glycosyltransferase involved in cell wall biosynthesis